MKRELELRLTPQEASDEKYFKPVIARELDVNISDIMAAVITRRSIDARKKQVMIQVQVDVWIGEMPPAQTAYSFDYKNVASSPEVIVVGAGPAGLFAALRLIELGVRPIVVERGKDVSARKKDLALLNRNQGLDTESNYAFGEGGAGTYSDGKLYTRSTKRGDFRKVLEVFVHHGAKPEILIDTHPHIGTDKLPAVIKNMRNTIIDCGGVVMFNSKVDDFLVRDGRVAGVHISSGQTIEAKAVILATGHSARDIYRLLNDKNIAIEQKSWAMGVRVEHPQELIDQIQYHSPEGRGDYLPAASYSLSAQVEGRGVYSFCMCPGGFIVPAMTAENEMVVNGMSPGKRNSPYANSGIVVEIRPEDIGPFQNEGVLGVMKYQQELERLAFINGGRGVVAPAQRLADFVKGRLSFDLPEVSYVPGIVSSPMHFWLPDSIGQRLRKGFEQFGRQAHGYVTNDAVVLGVESRTSSPIRIPRDHETLQHKTVAGLFPCGEGAGYAGGIASSAIDGERCAERAAALALK
jgi:uncharacterized FAD-dependent dehydrogenase